MQVRIAFGEDPYEAMDYVKNDKGMILHFDRDNDLWTVTIPEGATHISIKRIPETSEELCKQ